MIKTLKQAEVDTSEKISCLCRDLNKVEKKIEKVGAVQQCFDGKIENIKHILMPKKLKGILKRFNK